MARELLSLPLHRYNHSSGVYEYWPEFSTSEDFERLFNTPVDTGPYMLGFTIEDFVSEEVHASIMHEADDVWWSSLSSQARDDYAKGLLRHILEFKEPSAVQWLWCKQHAPWFIGWEDQDFQEFARFKRYLKGEGGPLRRLHDNDPHWYS
jgi:hypothetical protein